MQPGALPPEVLAFEGVIAAALSEDNAARYAAEQSLQQTKQQQPDAYCTALTLLLGSSQRPQPVREFAAVMIRQMITPPAVVSIAVAEPPQPPASSSSFPSSAAASPSSKDLYSRLSASTVKQLQETLLWLFEHEEVRAVRRKAVDAMGALCERCLGNGGWPDFMPAFLAACKSPIPLHRESVLQCIETLSERVDVALLMPHLPALRGVIVDSLQSAEARLRLAALQALIAFLLCLDQSEASQMQDTIPLMFRALHAAYAEQDEELLTSGCLVLSQLVKAQAAFLRPHLSSIISMMVGMVANRRLEEASRRSALEFLLALAESGKGMVRKTESFARDVIPLPFALLVELDDDISDWSSRDADAEDGDDDGNENFKMGGEAAARLAQALGGRIFINSAIPLVHQHIHSAVWQQRHAALLALAAMMDSIAAAMEPLLDTLVALVLPFMRDAHPRVAHAALECVEQMIASYSPGFQEQHHAAVMPAVLEVLERDGVHGRLVTSGCLLIMEFCREVESGVVAEYSQRLLTAAGRLIERRSSAVQEAVITVISALSLALGSAFIPYYPAIYPGIRQLVLSPPSPATLRLRGKAIECIGTIAEAVGPDVFMPEANTLMQALVSIKQSLSSSSSSAADADDGTLNYIVAAEARIAKCIGSAFIPYLPYVIPPLLRSAAITDELAVLNEGDSSALEQRPGYETTTYEVRGGQQVRITLNTALFEEKSTAFHMLFQYAAELKGGFLPFVKQTAEVVIPAMSYMSENVRLAAISACPALIRCAVDGLRDDDAERERLVRGLFSAMLPVFIDCSGKELMLDNLCGVLDALSDAIAVMGCPMRDEEQEMLCRELALETVASQQRMERREQRRSDADFDEEEEAAVQEENNGEEEFLGFVYQCIAAAIDNAGAAFLPHYHAQLQPVFSALLAHPNIVLVTTALCTVGQVVNDLPLPPPLQSAYCDALFPVCLQYARHESMDVRQSALFGIGACCQQLGPRFAAVMNDAVRVCLEVIRQPGSKEEDSRPATDNAVSALEKIASVCAAAMTAEQRRQLLSEVVDALPCVGDVKEAQRVHDRLIAYVKDGDAAVIGEGGERLQKLMQMLASLLDSDFVSDAGQQAIAEQFARWQQQASQQDWAAFMSTLDDEDRQSVGKALQTVAAAAVAGGSVGSIRPQR